MLTEITNGMPVYRPRQTSTGLYFESYRVSELTGRKLDLVTVVPSHVWGKHESPFFTSMQLPAKDLIDEKEFQRLASSERIHPAMTVSMRETLN